MKKAIQKPVNWQDFESLCKKLWGEIWKCSSIKKNGKQGQKQNGVDIYGIPSGETAYYGIQCKERNNDSKIKLSINEVDDIIEQAKKFKPELKCFIIATTASKDNTLEEHIRKRNIDNLKSGLFEIDLYAWEDIADLIEENKSTYEWYVLDRTHKSKYNIDILINDKNGEIDLNPEFINNITRYETDTEAVLSRSHTFLIQKILNDRLYGIKKISAIYSYHSEPECTKTDLSKEELTVELINTGDVSLENYVLEITADTEKVIFCANRKTKHGGIQITNMNRKIEPSKVAIKKDIVEYRSNSADNIIIPKDKRGFVFYIALPSEEINFNLKFNFLSSEYSTVKEISCISKPIIEKKVKILEPGEGEESSRIEPKIITDKGK